MNPNELPQDIQEAARTLADAILADPQAKAYQATITDFENDLQASALETRFMNLYAELTARQQKGKSLSQQDIEPFYAMRSEYYAHPRVVARNDALGALKPLLTEAADQTSVQLILDFTELAKLE